MIYGLLPLLRGWMYVYKEPEGLLYYGQEKVLDTVEAPGWLLFFSGRVSDNLDGKYVRLVLEIDGPEKAYTIEASAYELKEHGVVMPTNYSAYLTVYDDTNRVYAGCINPSIPMPFSRRFTLKAIPPNTPIEETVIKPIKYRAAYALVKITDVEEFKRSLQELLWVETKRVR